MEGVVAKRCLRESRIGKYDNSLNINRKIKEKYNDVYKRNFGVSKRINKQEEKERKLFEKIVFKSTLTLWIQSITALFITVIVIACNLINIKYIDNNKYIKLLKEEYKKSYKMNEIKDKTVVATRHTLNIMLKIVPDKVQEKFKNIYFDFKQKLSENTDNNNVVIYNEANEEKTTTKNEGMGASIIETELGVEKEEVIPAVSAISSEDEHIRYVKENNIKFVMPTTGTITSEFGAREVIFSDIDPYHTGLDIANVKGTNILASTDGTVTKVANNKYNGNFVEITNGKVVTKYAHMQSVSVKSGTSVKAGDIIGKMGDTGYATGSHLHFEVVIDGVKINPKNVLNI